MAHVINERVSALRNLMSARNIDAFIIPGTDPHMSEYIADHWKCREWISGFNGSAGTVVITREDAGLWTDSRYFIQAAMQLENTPIRLFKEGLPETPSINDYLISVLPKGATIAVDGSLFPVNAVEELKHRFSAAHLTFLTDFTPFDEIWTERPAIPEHSIYEYPEERAGESVLSKRERILMELHKTGANAILLTALDDIAWTLNIRGTDVDYNPVAICYAFLSAKENIIFADKEKLTVEIKKFFDENNIITASYDKLTDFLGQLPKEYHLLVDPAKVNQNLYDALSHECVKIKSTSPVALLKAVKNETQIEGFRSALIKDGVALTRFFRWLEEQVPTGTVTETGIATKLTEFREEQEGFMGESFGTIAGFREHGAIVHYNATPESDATITSEGFLLIDSGGQYLDGTTDITRTIILGTPDERQKRDFTLVLKGHINLALTKYPKGTRGDQLDVLARQALWNLHMNYLHGTGHGIGHFLNVHEGPQSIRMNHNPVILQPGMITSNEPGLYIAGEYGIRHENLILTVEDGTSPFGDFYKFETLTLFPFDLNGIEPSLLTAGEREWLNDYHRNVYETLSTRLTIEEQEWLAAKTKAI